MASFTPIILALVALAASSLVAATGLGGGQHDEQFFRGGPQVGGFEEGRVGGHHGSFGGPQQFRFLDRVSDEELLGELSIRRNALQQSQRSFRNNEGLIGGQRVGGFNGGALSRRGGNVFPQQKQLIAGQSLAAGSNAFEQGSQQAVGGQFDVEREHDSNRFENRKASAASLRGDVSDKGAHNKKSVSEDSKTIVNEKHLRANEDQGFHDREGHIEADAISNDKTQADSVKDRKSASGKVGAASSQQSSGQQSGVLANSNVLASEQ